MLNRIVYSILLLVILLNILFYLAYAYKPEENSEFSSGYLAKEDDKYIQLQNYKAHYLVKGSGEPVILIHGGGSWLYSYRNNINELSKYYKVYAVDMPGHGYTKANTTIKYDLDTYADFLKEFLDSQNINSVRVVGHSWGGGWAIYFAEKYKKMVSQLVLLDSSGLNQPDKSEWRYLQYPIIGEIVSKVISMKNTRKSLQKMFINQDILTDNYVEEIYTPLSYSENRNAQVQAQRNLDWRVTEEKMNKINEPVLIIFGSKDCYFDNKYQRLMHNKLSNSELVVIDNTSHIPHEEQYSNVDKLILDFFGKQ